MKRRRRRRSVRGNALAQSVRSLLAEKRELQAKERGLMKLLNGALTKIGYKVVPASAAASDGRRRRKGRRRRPGRPPGRPRKAPALAGRTRKRGRPAKSQ